MAKQTTLPAYYLGTDFAYIFEILNEAETAALDIGGWALSFMVKRDREDSDAAALITKTTGDGAIVIAGVFDAVPATNQQRATVTIADSDTDPTDPAMRGTKWWELKRTDAGLETVLADGTVPFRRGVHHT